MFTGIVEELATLRSCTGDRFVVDAPLVTCDLKIGDSVAHDGCCLTVVEVGDGWYAVQAVEETLRRTTLGDLRPGDRVNLERPVRPLDRLGGHLVQGHVDGIGTIARPAPDLEVAVAPELGRYLVEKGSVTVDGCSLTVVWVSGSMGGGEAARFGVAVIPHTAAVTTLGHKKAGDHVNVEVDLVAKYVERLLADRAALPLAPPGS